MKKVKIQLLTTETPDSFESHIGLSETIPGQSLPINEILIRFQRGTMDMDIQKKIYYDNIEDFIANPTLSPDFDLADATILSDKLNLFIQEQTRLKLEAEAALKASEMATKPNEAEGA